MVMLSLTQVIVCTFTDTNAFKFQQHIILQLSNVEVLSLSSFTSHCMLNAKPLEMATGQKSSYS